MAWTTPAYVVQQDAQAVRVRIECEGSHVRQGLTQATTARAAADGTTIGCFIDPLYLPYVEKTKTA